MINAVALEQGRGKVALQRSKTKTIVTISLQQKLDRAITKTADAVVKDDWVGHGFTHDSTLSLAA